MTVESNYLKMIREVILSALIGLVCGAPQNIIPKLDGKVVGGVPIVIENAGYQVSVLWLGSHVCGGVIIAAKTILTAAHCTDDYSSAPDTFQIRAGSSYLNYAGVIMDVKSVHIHEQYDKFTLDYDYSVLTLTRGLSFSSSIRPAGIASVDFPVDTNMRVTGWGSTSEDGDLSPQLHAVVVQKISDEVCADAYGPGKISESMMCAGVSGGGKDACQGDSGGPLVVDGYYLVGISSWGYGCGRPQYPGVYTNVKFINEYLQGFLNE